MFIHRSLEEEIQNSLKMYPIISVTGPRQSGKTTMLRGQFSEYAYVNLERLADRDQAKNDPEGFFKRYPGKVIIDEVQRVPELFSQLQVIVDEDQEMGRFILSGSQSFGLLKSIQQSLAGRIAIFELMPLDQNELKGAGLLDDRFANQIITGAYPAVYSRPIPQRSFYNNYLKTYVERDVPEVLDVRDINQFRNFIRLVALRAGSLMNWNSLGSDADISFPTVKSWISLLESSYITFSLRPYFNRFQKRIIKSPKVYFYDTGLLCHLLNIRSADELLDSQYKGHVFENYIISEIIKSAMHKGEEHDFYFWRDSNGNEVDLLSRTADQYRLYEIKSSQTIKQSQFKGLNYVAALIEKGSVEKHLIYAGDENYQYKDVHIHSWDKMGELIY